MITCKVCNKAICKYEKDWKSSGAISIDKSWGNEPVQMVDICQFCAIKIAKELIESI